MESTSLILSAPKGKGRKKGRQPEAWKRAKAKHKRYCAPGFPQAPKCRHIAGAGTPFRCASLTLQDIRRANQAFYQAPEKLKQDEFLLRQTLIEPVKRKRSRIGKFDKQVTVKYFLPRRVDQNSKEQVRVCKKTFVAILSITEKRVERVCKRHYVTGNAPVEKRGGDRRSEEYAERKAAVKSFIERLHPVESHYCRGKNVHRQYLASDLSITLLWKQYNATNPELSVKGEYFRKIFTEDYNIGFGSPATDASSTCISLQEKLKVTRDPDERNELSGQLQAHKKKADTFYSYLQEEAPGELTLSFDCQKNLVLPKLPDQSAYFSRQLYMYNFTVCQGTSHSSQSKENTFCYLWRESDHGKGSNEIASFLYHRLNNTDLSGIHTIRLFSDGCGGQNKNQVMISMLCKFLQEMVDIVEIRYYYPVVGHSYIPPDRVFGKIEKQIKRKSTIITANDYIKIIEEFGTVLDVSSGDCQVFDWKAACHETMKPPSAWHFKFAPMKRIVITRSPKGNPVIQGEPFYNEDVGEPRSLVKRGKTFSAMKPVVVVKGVSVKPAKKNDVENLLAKHYGDNWRSLEDLSYFKDVIDGIVVEEEDTFSDFGDLPQEEPHAI